MYLVEFTTVDLLITFEFALVFGSEKYWKDYFYERRFIQKFRLSCIISIIEWVDSFLGNQTNSNSLGMYNKHTKVDFMHIEIAHLAKQIHS